MIHKLDCREALDTIPAYKTNNNSLLANNSTEVAYFICGLQRDRDVSDVLQSFSDGIAVCGHMESCMLGHNSHAHMWHSAFLDGKGQCAQWPWIVLHTSKRPVRISIHRSDIHDA